MKLEIRERIISSLVYFIIIIGFGFKLNGNSDFFFNSSNDYYVLFVASALMLIMGDYIIEPYYTKPVDVIAKTFAILLVLGSIPIEKQQTFILFNSLFYFNCALLLLSIVLTLLSHMENFQKTRHLLLFIITKIGTPSIIFSILYLLTLFSFFDSNTNEFLFLFGLWLLLIFKMPVETFAKWIIKGWSFYKNKETIQSIGTAIGCDNPFLYQVEVINETHQKYSLKKGQLVYLELEDDIALVGIIFNEKHLLDKKWLSVYILENKKTEPLKINLKTNKLINTKTIYSKHNQMYTLELSTLENEEIKELIESNYMYKYKDRFIGYISENSNINKIRFHLLLDDSNKKHISIGEGTILSSKIFSNDTLFQILDGVTEEEKLESHNNYGFTTVIAKKIGNYNKKNNELTTVKWLPRIYSPVFLLEDEMEEYDYEKFIGKLPNTNYGVSIKNYDELVTHNTAILGILGVGKSRLTFELLKKVIENTNSKVICIDITNQYANELEDYIDKKFIKNDIKTEVKNELNITSKTTGSDSKPSEWGNIDKYKDILKKSFSHLIKPTCDTRVLILNPNAHTVTKAGTNFKISFCEELTITEKTRIISEEIFKQLMEEGESNKAKCLLVYEEAHSLIPEWNSSANTGDQTASNGTAKVILQGRKYGLGSFVITQRTANISKSILNQCNTIFAMRVFDDTGKQFLENYIGSDYANTLPTLEERHAIVTGKAMRLKQPIIIRLNDMDKIEKGKNDE